jgi:hypothetical protein
VTGGKISEMELVGNVKSRLVQDDGCNGEPMEVDIRLPDIFIDRDDEDEYGLGIEVSVGLDKIEFSPTDV